MTSTAIGILAAMGLYGDAPDAKHAWAVHDWTRPKPAKVEPAPYVRTGAPSDAIILFDGTRESFERNWRDANGGRPGWSYSEDGYFYSVPGGKNGATRFVYCSTPNWMKPREKLSVHALILFADIKGDKVTDITRHCVFKNPMPR